MFEMIKPVRVAALLTVSAMAAPTLASEKPVVMHGDISNLRVVKLS